MASSLVFLGFQSATSKATKPIKDPEMYGSFTLNQQKVQLLATQRAAQSIIETKASPQKMNDSSQSTNGAGRSRAKPFAESSFV